MNKQFPEIESLQSRDYNEFSVLKYNKLYNQWTIFFVEHDFLTDLSVFSLLMSNTQLAQYHNAICLGGFFT